MIRQICPHCFQSVTLPDEAAGTTTPCPLCEKGFPIPGRYNPAVDPGLGSESGPAAPPPGVAPPTTRPAVAPPPGFVPPEEIGVSARPLTRGLTLNPAVLDWFPAGCFTLIFLLTFFPWAGFYPGGYSAYTQAAWGAATGGFSTDSFAEGVLNIQTKIRELIPSNWILLIYLAGLLAALGLAWVDRFFVQEPRGNRTPARLGALEALWPHRFPILAGLAVGLLALLLIQFWAGFGLETAARRIAQVQVAEQTQGNPTLAADTETAAQTLRIKRGLAQGQFQAGTTTWLNVVLGTHFVAAAAVGLRLWLYRRGSKPLPRLGWEV